MSKKSRFRIHFEKQDGKRVQTLLKFKWQQLYHIYWSMWGKSSCRKSLLVICKFLRLFVSTVTVNDKYFLLNKDNLKQPIQIQLPQKQKTFSKFFSQLLQSAWNFKHFKQKMTLIPNVFPKIRTPKNVLRSMSKKSRFRRPFEKQDAKRFQTLLKSEGQHLQHISLSLWRQLTYKKSLLVIEKFLILFVNNWLLMTSILFVIETV